MSLPRASLPGVSHPSRNGGAPDARPTLDGGQASAARRAVTQLARTADALERDEAARLRDLAALGRDRATEACDRAAARALAALDRSAEPELAVAAVRRAAARLSQRAASDRARAAEDRLRAAEDRDRAAEDRRLARLELRRAQIDELTGLYTRGIGLATIAHEIQRAHRSGDPFVIAFIDVDGLKQINDRSGHAAGDAVLRAVGAELRARLRPYDPVVRVGGDEFVCALSNTTLEAAAARLLEVRAALEGLEGGGSISVGLAELRPGESLEDLTGRGDAALYRVKQTRARSRRAPPAARHEHLVEFYDSDAFLVETVGRFIGPPLRGGDAAIVVATPEHRLSFEAALEASGVDVLVAAAAGRYLGVDASDMLAEIMVAGTPDPERFRLVIGAAIERAAGPGPERRVFVYGEMVALLWDGGDVEAAIRLEDLWNELAATHRFSLLCAYPMRAFAAEESAEWFQRICDRHTTVIPAEDYPRLGGADQQQRAVARLQQDLATVRADLARLRAAPTTPP